MGYHLETHMTDMLIRDVPEEVIAALDLHLDLPLATEAVVPQRPQPGPPAPA
jgi:hypothetical protein